MAHSLLRMLPPVATFLILTDLHSSIIRCILFIQVEMGGYSEDIGVIEMTPSNTTPFEVIVACIIVFVVLTIGVAIVSVKLL